MSEATPHVPTPAATAAAAAKAEKAETAARNAEIAKLVTLQKEYDKLKQEVEDGLPADPAVAAKLKRKGAVVREMDVIKRAHDIQDEEITAATKPAAKP